MSSPIRSLGSILTHAGLLSGVFALLSAQAHGQTYSRSYSTTGYSGAVAVAETPSGHFVTVGVRESNGIDLNAIAMAVDERGQPLWSFDYVAPQRKATLWTDVEVSATGSVVAVGTYEFFPWIASLDPDTGAVQWQVTHRSIFGFYEALCPAADGGWFVAGCDFSSFGRSDLLVSKLRADGQAEWHRLLGNSSVSEDASAVVPTADGGVVVAGYGGPVAPGSDRPVLISLDAQGNVRWDVELDVQAQLAQQVALAQADDGSLYFAAISGNGSLLVKLDSAGSVLWERLLSGEPSACESLLAVEGGCVINAILTDSSGTPEGAWQGKIDPNGQLLWQVDYRGTAFNRLLGLGAAPGGQIAVGTQSVGPTTSATWIVRTDAEGILVDDCTMTNPGTLTTQAVTSTLAPLAWNVQSPSTARGTPSVNLTARQEVIVEHCADFCHVQFQTIGHGLVGSGGIEPTLTGIDGFCRGEQPQLHIDSGLGGAPGLILVSAGMLGNPFFGGTLYPDLQAGLVLPIRLQGAPGVPGAGSLHLTLTDGLHELAGSSLIVQLALLDSGAPQGISLTAAQQVQVQP